MADFKAFFLKNKDDIIKPIVVLLSICIVIAFALSLTNKITAEKIAGLEAENEQKTMSELIKAESFEKKSLDEVEYHIAKNGDETVGFIFVTSAKGYGGDVSVMTAVNTDGSIKAVAVLDASNETPGLGQNVTKEKFYSQYEEKTADVKVVKNGAVSENNEINAVTGATISSKAVTSAVNMALENYKAVAETEVAVNE